eukprot:scaffold17757_cov62-Phaeocystis_antarctica.AAC.4
MFGGDFGLPPGPRYGRRSTGGAPTMSTIGAWRSAPSPDQVGLMADRRSGIRHAVINLFSTMWSRSDHTRLGPQLHRLAAVRAQLHLRCAAAARALMAARHG